MSVLELVAILVISDAVQNSMVGENTSLWGGIVAVITLLGLDTAIKAATGRSRRLRNAVEGEPRLLVRDGRLLQRALRRGEDRGRGGPRRGPRRRPRPRRRGPPGGPRDRRHDLGHPARGPAARRTDPCRDPAASAAPAAARWLCSWPSCLAMRHRRLRAGRARRPAIVTIDGRPWRCSSRVQTACAAATTSAAPTGCSSTWAPRSSRARWPSSWTACACPWPSPGSPPTASWSGPPRWIPCAAAPCPRYLAPAPFRWAVEAPAGAFDALAADARLEIAP